MSKVVNAWKAVSRAGDSQAVKDVCLLLARAILAFIFIYHGGRTMFGAFGGGGLSHQAQYFSTTAHLHPAMFFAVLNGITEFFGGIAIAVGMFSRLAALGLVADMLMAIVTVTHRQGIAWSLQGSGYELNLGFGGMALLLVLTGPGRYSLESLVSRLPLAERFSHPAPSPEPAVR